MDPDGNRLRTAINLANRRIFRAAEQLQEPRHRAADILILVHQHIAQPILIAFEHVGVAAEELCAERCLERGDTA